MKNIQQCGELNSNVGENRTEKAINENKIVYTRNKAGGTMGQTWSVDGTTSRYVVW